MFLSVFDLFKIGIGPSSSHTMGPMTAARFLGEFWRRWPRPAGARVDRIGASLHGSLAYTGIGHGTDRAVVLGPGRPDARSPSIPTGPRHMVADDRGQKRDLAARPSGLCASTRRRDLVLDKKTPLPGHANGMAFYGLSMPTTGCCCKRIYYSIGGGFVVSEEELQRLKARGPATPKASQCPIPSPMPARCWRWRRASGLSIAEMKRANEETRRRRGELDAGLDAHLGGHEGLHRPRPVAGRHHAGRAEGAPPRPPCCTTSCRRSGGRTGPTRCSPMTGCRSTRWRSTRRMPPAAASSRRRPTARPAWCRRCIRYWLHFHAEADQASIRDFLLTAAAIGGIIKPNASISGAEVGCQGEVGSASAMAAAGLCAVMGGTPGAGRERRRDRARASSRHDLRSGRRAGAGAVHRAQRARRGQGGDRRLAGASRATASTSCRSTRRSRRCARPAST